MLLAPLAIHLAWRLSYYGYPLPNTYYAKLGGQSSAGLGIQYLAFFVVEYALVLWIPFVVDGIRAWRRLAPSAIPMLVGGFVPYLAYVVYAGGDHFEFRLIDMLWVPLALLFQSGVGYRALQLRRPGQRALLYGAAVAVLGISMLLPTLSHRGYPPGALAGFPGLQAAPSGSRDLIRPASAPRLLRLPGVRLWLDSYNALARSLTAHYVGLRQEYHRQAVELTIALGMRLRQFVDAGSIPEDARIAVNAAGAIPYFSRLWTLDRVGLCDSHVAHGPQVGGAQMLAHRKMAEPWYQALVGVDLSAVHPYSFFVGDRTVERTQGAVLPRDARNYYVVRLGPDDNFLAYFPLGPERTRPRFPRLDFIPLATWKPLAAD